MRLQRIPPLDAAETFFMDLLPDVGREPADDRNPVRAAEPDCPAHAPLPFWQRIVSLGMRHRLIGYLCSRHQDRIWWENCPAPVRQTFRQFHMQTTLRNTLYRQELERVLAALDSRGIRPLLLKGAALNVAVYADLGERSHGDIDLLLSPAELEAARPVMEELGYRIDTSTGSESFYRKHHFHLIYRHADKPWCCFELHWDLSVPLMDVELPAEQMRRNAKPLAWRDRTVNLPAAEDFLLHLCMHSGLNGFSVLAQIRDVHALLALSDHQFGAELFWNKARSSRLIAPAVMVLEMAGWFGPSPQRDRLLQAAPAVNLARLRSLLRRENVLRGRLKESAAGGHAVAVLRRDRLRDRWRYFGRLVRPGAADRLHGGRRSESPALDESKRVSRRGLALACRSLAYMALARTGWEAVPTLPEAGGWRALESPFQG